MRRMTRKHKAQRDKRRAQRAEWAQQEYPALIARALFAEVSPWAIQQYKGASLYERYSRRTWFESLVQEAEQPNPEPPTRSGHWSGPAVDIQTFDRLARESERYIDSETLTEGDYREYRPETRQGKNRPGLGPSVLRQHPAASAADRHRFRTYARRR